MNRFIILVILFSSITAHSQYVDFPIEQYLKKPSPGYKISRLDKGKYLPVSIYELNANGKRKKATYFEKGDGIKSIRFYYDDSVITKMVIDSTDGGTETWYYSYDQLKRCTRLERKNSKETLLGWIDYTHNGDTLEEKDNFFKDRGIEGDVSWTFTTLSSNRKPSTTLDSFSYGYTVLKVYKYDSIDRLVEVKSTYGKSNEYWETITHSDTTVLSSTYGIYGKDSILSSYKLTRLGKDGLPFYYEERRYHSIKDDDQDWRSKGFGYRFFLNEMGVFKIEEIEYGKIENTYKVEYSRK